MRNFKKLLVVICVLSILTVSCVFAALAAEEGSVEELNTLITTAENETNAANKYEAVLDVAEYISTHKLHSSATGYDEAMARAHKLSVDGAAALLALVDVNGVKAADAYNNMMKADELLSLFKLADDVEGYADVKAQFDSALVRALGALVAECDANIETTRTTAKNGIAIKKVNSLLHYCPPFGDESVLDAVKADFAVLEEAHNRAMQANYVELDSTNKISNYDLPVYIEHNWESSKVGLDTANVGSSWSVDLKGIANKFGVLQEANGNKYLVHRYLEKDNPQGSYAQISLSKVDSSAGLVFEFDVTTFDVVPNQGVMIETGSVGGAYFPPPYFYINSNGDICKNDKSTVALSGAIVRGEWTHIVLVLDPDSFVYNLYIDGQFVCEYDAKYQGITRYEHSKVAFRISGGPATSGEIAIDNLKIYGGDSYRIHDRLEKMNDDEKFLYYVDYLVDENNVVAERSVAYNTASSLIENYWVVDENGNGTYTEYALANPGIMDAVDTYVAFDLETFLYEVGMKNLNGYIELVEALSAISRDLTTSAQRKQQVELIYAYVDKNGDLINRTADSDSNGKADFYEYESIVSTANREANYDANAVDFIRYIERFEKSATLSAKQRNYNQAAELAENDGIDITLILDESYPNREKFQTLIDAYAVYRNADQVLYELTLSNNSSKIVKCIGKISMYTTEEEWLANREVMEEYLGLLKNVVFDLDENGEHLYDLEVEGVEEALAFFHESYSFFYAILQTEHVEHMRGVLDRIAITDAYIEKMGMVSYLEKYIETNDINFEDERIADIINDLDTCKSELVLREADYAKILVQNSVYFINLVERMRTAQTYNEQREYFEEAYLLYFNIDVSVEGASEAVEIFDEYKINLERIAESSVKFIETVAIYRACETEDEKYAALVECYYNAQFVEMSYDGAEEAMAEYLAAYNAYMNYAESVNAEITHTANAVGSLRANCGITNVIAIIIKKLFGV